MHLHTVLYFGNNLNSEVVIVGLNRAIEIVKSLGVTDVTYKNESVWIEDINAEQETAFVKKLATGDIEEVRISELME